MLTNESLDYRLQTVTDGLMAISATSEEKECINYNFALTIDDVFDHEPLDWLNALVSDGVLSESIAEAIVSLYQEINEFTKRMSIEQEDKFIRSDDNPLPAWAIRARDLLSAINHEPN